MIMNLDYKVEKLKAKWPKSLTQKTVTIVNNNYGLKNEILLSLVKYDIQGPVPERPISVNLGLKFCSVFVFYIPMHCLG